MNAFSPTMSFVFLRNKQCLSGDYVGEFVVGGECIYPAQNGINNIVNMSVNVNSKQAMRGRQFARQFYFKIFFIGKFDELLGTRDR